MCTPIGGTSGEVVYLQSWWILLNSAVTWSLGGAFGSIQ
jgi:hypothetical protein